ncbi:U3 small nucleolar RNA-associated protein 4 homolog [Strigops habroptila]|uniref:U3 small nucleolar RNA-associated protein 4 homolog n=1 Tax=Strigops habroptila TaxID=2489341 RepID=UPI0011D01371|nr:U3 small nucleolar RNA-associated protein 4 homolog [Strigops habroptila]
MAVPVITPATCWSKSYFRKWLYNALWFHKHHLRMTYVSMVTGFFPFLCINAVIQLFFSDTEVAFLVSGAILCVCYWVALLALFIAIVMQHCGKWQEQCGLAFTGAQAPFIHGEGVSAGCPEALYLLAPSADGHWLVAVSGDWAIHIYNLKCFKHHCMVLTYSCVVTALTIHPITNHLVITYSGQQLFEFSIPEKQHTAWSCMVQNCRLHKVWLERDLPITHITFNPKNPLHILLHDIYMLCILDKSLPLPDNSALMMNQSTLKQLPETAGQWQLHAFKICKKFQPLLFADLLDDNCLVMVEWPIMDIKTQLPLPIQQKKFVT